MTTAEAERLSLIRYQLLSAAEMVRQPPPINSLAINPLQDVVEATLAAVAEHVLADVKARPDFDKLFDAVVGKLGSPPELTGLRAPAIALNNARVGFKHHGNQVRDETLRRHYDVAATLVHELIRVGFAVSLDDVSMLLFIPHEGVRAFIERAEARAQENDLTGALTYLRSAFDLAVDDYSNRKSLDGWYSIFRSEPITRTNVSPFGNQGWEKPYDELQKWMQAIDTRVRLSAIGVDLGRYSYFDAVAPSFRYMWHSGRGPLVHVRFENPTDEHYKASYLFVVDTAIRLSVHDFNLTPVRLAKHRPQDAYDPEFQTAEYRERTEANKRRLEEREAQQGSSEQEV